MALPYIGHIFFLSCNPFLVNVTILPRPSLSQEFLPKEYFEIEHLPGAINIPHDEVSTKAPLLVPEKSGTVIVYCANLLCQNSRMAAETFRQMGYHNVLEYAEGKKGWKEAGLPLETAN